MSTTGMFIALKLSPMVAWYTNVMVDHVIVDDVRPVFLVKYNVQIYRS